MNLTTSDHVVREFWTSGRENPSRFLETVAIRQL